MRDYTNLKNNTIFFNNLERVIRDSSQSLIKNNDGNKQSHFSVISIKR